METQHGQILVKLPAGNSIPFSVVAGDTIGTVKGKIMEKESIPVSEQRLTHTGGCFYDLVVK